MTVGLGHKHIVSWIRGAIFDRYRCLNSIKVTILSMLGNKNCSFIDNAYVGQACKQNGSALNSDM